MVDDSLSSAVVTFVGYDGDGAVPGRYPSRIGDPDLRQGVLEILTEIDHDADLRAAGNLSAWGNALVARVSERHPELSGEALAALTALLTFEWR